MDSLVLTSCQAPIADPFVAAVARYLARSLKLSAQVRDDIPWRERERLLDAGAIDLGWICGLPYIWKADRPDPALELLAAPVMQHPRYEDRPVYFSDVVVHHASRFHDFAELRGAVWAYNEPHSHSGYNVVRFFLAQQGTPVGFFGTAIEAGSHQAAIALVRARRVDAAAIDSMVLQLAAAADPALAAELRVIATLGPSPMPPWVIGRHVAPELRERIRAALLAMHHDREGRVVLAASGLARFELVGDRDYDPLREMERSARHVRLTADAAGSQRS